MTSIDVRTQTEYGTLRAYSRAGFQTTTGETAQGKIYTERGFIQFAGFTLGKSQSYFDFFGGKFCYGCIFLGNSSTTDGNGTLLAAYTATFGNGFTATISLEDNFMRRSAVWDASNDATNALVIGNVPGPASAANSFQPGGVNLGDVAATGIPDMVGSLRVDQAWGSAQIAGALHQLRAGYYGNNTTGAGASVLGVDNRFLSPNDAYGWAAMAGIVINLPWQKGDKFWVEATLAHGAGAYVGWTNLTTTQVNTLGRFNGANVAAAWAINSIFGALPSTNGATGQQLTNYFSIAAAIEHYWTPALRSDFFGSYTAADFNDVATTLFCSSPQSPIRRIGAPNTPLTGTTVAAGCNPDFNVWNVGVRTIWNPAPQFDVGVEVMYSRIETKHDPNQVVLNFAGAGGRPAGVYFPSSEGVWSWLVRLQRNFWP